MPQVKFLAVFVSGLFLMVIAASFAPPTVQIVTVGALVSILAGLLVISLDIHRERQVRFGALLERIRIPMSLAAQHRLFDDYERFATGLVEIAKHPSSVFRELATLRISSVCDEITELARGKVLFSSTETWRAAYRDVLEGLTVKTYYSVAWVRTTDYWDDPPGRHGMQLNFQLAQRGYRIERVVILPDHLWPYDHDCPLPEIRHWIDQQNEHGIVLSLVREHELANEPALLCDFGIYGDQAVAYQQLDEHSRTVCYLLDFDPQARKKAFDRFERLALYATPYGHMA